MTSRAVCVGVGVALFLGFAGVATAATPVSALEAAARWTEVWRVTGLVLGIGAILAGALALERLGRADTDEAGQKAYRQGAIGLATAATLLVLAMLAAIPGGLWRDSEEIARQDWFRNNFELPLVAFGIAIVAVADRINRAIARERPRPQAASGPGAPGARVAFGHVSSVIIGCAVGVSILVAIGSSAFSASLWQREMRAYVGDDAQVSLERVQFMVDRIGALDDQITLLDGEVERLKAQMRDHDARSAAYAALHERLWLEASTLLARTPPDPERASALRQDAREATLDALQEQARAEEMAGRADLLIDEIDLIELRQRCRVHQFAEVIANRTAAGDAPPPAPLGPRGEDAACDTVTSAPRAALARANAILETAQPLRRSWMSSQLARRTPILLSIELVLLMGALGALLRATATALSPRQRPAHAGGDERGALLPLGLSIVFGMSTALVFFVLMKAALTAASMEGLQAGDAADDLNPFTIALLGLAGGYAAREVLSWLGSVVRDRGRRDDDARRRNRDDDDTADDNDDDAAGDDEEHEQRRGDNDDDADTTTPEERRG